ncbi:unnamed protein product [Plutella xylostella]|uniref:(diamondback moth) hypothetical protein n=1 Tax=Plutella xylostella TaxID=51655 RepID=A0A8S4DYA9_PLUXY|nr:unnamed protein product [Plutella xylostella]
MSQLVPYNCEQDDSLMFATMFDYQHDVAKRRVGACRERGGGSGRGAVVLCLRCTAAAPAGVGVVGGRRAGLIRRWRGRRASLTPRSTTARATRVTPRSFTPQ